MSSIDEARLRLWFEAGLSQYSELIQRARVEESQAGAATERERCAELIEEAFDGDVPFLPRSMDHPQVDVPDLFEFCKRLAARVRSGK